MIDAALTLVSETYAKDQYGVQQPTPAKHDIMVRVDEITRAEFFDAGRNGLNPEYKFLAFFGDYAGERECIYLGKPYAIYRTYHVPGTDDLEIYVARKGGTNNVK